MDPVAIAEAILLLEPLAQKGLVALINLFHDNVLTPEQLLLAAQALSPARTAITGIPHPYPVQWIR